VSDARFLSISVRVHGGRFHGMSDRETDEWPPSPARLFQALVAAAGHGGTISVRDREALCWLERLDAPMVGAPRMQRGQSVELFVPDNDLDAVQGNPARTSEIRSPKRYSPKLFDPDHPFLYVWSFDGEASQASAICRISLGLYQFGRGIDLAWAQARIDDEQARTLAVDAYPGILYRPSVRGGGDSLACPTTGSLASLEARHAGQYARFAGPSSAQQFSQAPKPRFLQVPYDTRTARFVYDLLREDRSYAARSAVEASRIVEWIRDSAADRLVRALPDHRDVIERSLIGRKPDGADAAPTGARVRIVPLASIGHEEADRRIRRILVEVPPICPLRAADVSWAFSGLELGIPETGEALGATLTPSGDTSMLRHYGTDAPARRWRTVTPVVLPESAKRRRIEPSRVAEEVKAGTERAAEEARAVAAVVQALRHADVRGRAETICVQREPFARKGERVEPFAEGTRFVKERLWHVEIGFATPLKGPLVIGDGRFLGLGVLAPVTQVDGVFAFAIEAGLERIPSPEGLARALRRAVMARVQATLGPRRKLPTFFTGHEDDGEPTHSAHLTFTFDPTAMRLLIIAPHIIERRAATATDREHLGTLQRALGALSELRGGSAGRLLLRPTLIDEEADPLLSPAATWMSATAYRVNRHAKGGAVSALIADLLAECRRFGLPEPKGVTTSHVRGISGVGLVGFARIEFHVAIPGPIALGRNRFAGGGLFIGGVLPATVRG
jgi:CRISPR-associated protein Csb2